jgi:hypothetical protein
MMSDLLSARGAGVRHRGATLLDHLRGVAAILRRWGAPEALCRAGLFHSVYGTEAFGNPLFTAEERDLVRIEIGVEAERLVALFCAVRRSSLVSAVANGEPYAAIGRDGGPVPLSIVELRSLITLAWANALEQETRQPSLTTDAALMRLAQVASWLPEVAVSELSAAYSTYRGRTVLARLLDAPTPELFLSRHWPAQPFIAHGPVQRLAGLVSYDFDDLVAMRKGFTRAFGRDRENKKIDLPVPAGQERTAYESGYTIYFHGLHAQPMAAWVDALDSELGLLPGATRVSAFASKRGLGLKPHYDNNSNFVCQAAGRKRWRYAANKHVTEPTVGYTVGEPVTPSHAIEAPNGLPEALPTPYTSVEMAPGSVMFMPRGVWHDTETLDEASVHINIQTGLVTWK